MPETRVERVNVGCYAIIHGFHCNFVRHVVWFSRQVTDMVETRVSVPRVLVYSLNFEHKRVSRLRFLLELIYRCKIRHLLLQNVLVPSDRIVGELGDFV